MAFLCQISLTIRHLSLITTHRDLSNKGGRSVFDGPTNGNWGGGCWSGGQHSCNGNPIGNAPPLDSADEAYMRHDMCYGSPGCDAALVEELKSLPDDSTQWPQPPRKGTEGD